MITVVKMKFGRCYLIDNVLRKVHYDYLVDTVAHPSFKVIYNTWFDPENDEDSTNYGAVPIRLTGYKQKEFDETDKKFIQEHFPEYLL